MDDKVIVESMVSGQIGINIPELRINKVWPRKGTKLPISKDFLREAIYDQGVEYMFKHGILNIEDMDFKVELGLEEPNTTEPTLIKVDQKYMERVLKLMSKSDMKKALEKMSPEQKDEFVSYTLNQRDVNLDRVAIVDEVCNTDVLKMIEIKKIKEG